MAKKEEAKQAAEAEAAEVSLLDQIVEQGRFGKAPAAKERGRDMVKQFVADVLEGTVAYHADTDAMINARIAQIDQLLSAQVNAGALAMPSTAPTAADSHPLGNVSEYVLFPWSVIT